MNFLLFVDEVSMIISLIFENILKSIALMCFFFSNISNILQNDDIIIDCKLNDIHKCK